MSGVFRGMQPVYAEHGIATFPVGGDKKPAITNYQRMGLRGSGQLVLVARHASATGLGFMSNARNGIAVLDYDDTDERGFIDALRRHGDTPIKIRTASGRYHAYYRYNGELRLIRGLDGSPIDILGSGGFAVAPPSEIPDSGSYQFVEGGLRDLDRLPVMRNLPARVYGKQDVVVSPRAVSSGARNDTLFDECMRAATRVNSFDELLLEARAFNEAYSPPLDDGEVVRVARSAWSYEERGLNRYGQHGAWIPIQEVDALLKSSQDAIVLLAFLRAYEAPWAKFWIANGLAERFGWTVKRLSNARKHLIERGDIVQVRPPRPGNPAEYVWGVKTRVVRID